MSGRGSGGCRRLPCSSVFLSPLWMPRLGCLSISTRNQRCPGSWGPREAQGSFQSFPPPVKWSHPNQSNGSEGRILARLVKKRESWGPLKAGFCPPRVRQGKEGTLAEEPGLRQ